MGDKSHVTMEQNVCVVCAKPFDTGAILLDKRLRERFDQHTLTGWGMCPEHEEKAEEGFVALVVIDPAASTEDPTTGNAKPDEVYRTGEIIHLRDTAWEAIFDAPIPEKMVCWIEPGVAEQLKGMVGEV